MHVLFLIWKVYSLTVNITFIGTKKCLKGIAAKLPTKSKN